MSNKQQIQTNNEKYASLIETLRGKAIPSGSEDLDTELTTQENLISQLSSILDSKASGGSGGGNVETCTVQINIDGLEFQVAYATISGNNITGVYEIYSDRGTLNIVKNSVLCISDEHNNIWSYMITTSENINHFGAFGYSSACHAFFIQDSGTINVAP